MAKQKIAILLKHIHITSVDAETVKISTQNRAIHDFEDGLEYYSAIHSNCKIIITEDTSDFYFSEIPVYNSEAFLESLN